MADQLPAWMYLFGQAPVAQTGGGRSPASENGLPDMTVPAYLQNDPSAALALQQNYADQIAENPAVEQAMPGAPAPQGNELALGGYLRHDPGVMQAQLAAFKKLSDQSLKDQNAGLDSLNKYIGDFEKRPSEVDWRPLAAYVDSIVPKSNLLAAAQAMAPMGEEEKAQKLFELKNRLQLGRQALSKEQLDALNTQMRMQLDQYSKDAMIQHYMNQDKIQQGRADVSGLRLKTQQDTQTSNAVDKVVNDKQLGLYTPRIDGARRILNQLQEARNGKIVDTSQFLNDLNTEYVALLTGANNAALGKLERTEYQTYAGKVANMIQMVTADPQSVNSPKIIKQLEDSVLSLKEDYQHNYEKRADKLGRSYANNPNAMREQQKTIQKLKKDYGVGSDNYKSQEQVKVWNGATYKLINGNWVKQ